MKKEFEPGSRIFVVERGIDGVPHSILNCCFLAQVANAAIVSPSVCYTQDQNNLENISQDLIYETANYRDCTLCIFPFEDCFFTRKEAEDVFAEYKRSKNRPLLYDGRLLVFPKEEYMLSLAKLYSDKNLKGVDFNYEK